MVERRGQSNRNSDQLKDSNFQDLQLKQFHRDNGPVEGWLKKCRFELFICTVLKHTGLTNTKKKKTKHKKQQTTNNNAT